MVMGLSPVVRWLVQGTFWCGLMFGYLCLGCIMMLIFAGYTPTAAAVPAFALLSLLAVPPIFCFIALFNFVFWCRTNVEDVVSQTFCNLIVMVVLWPTIILSAIPGVRDNTTAQSIITYALLIVPLNQLSFGLSAIYTVANVAIYTSAYVPGESGPQASDFFVWTVTNPVSGGSSPGPLICMAASLLSAPFWFWALWHVDVRRYYFASRAALTHSGQRHGEGPQRPEDPDVAAERCRVESGAADGALIRMVGLRKTFRMPKKNGKPQPDKVALDNLSLAIDGQGCFALLGPNGAGKTTALSVLTGDMRPTAGEAFVAGLSVRTQILDIFKLLGYCPQFGGLFPRGVTLKQHLVLYARLKGIAEADLEAHCARVLREFGLEDHAHKWVNYLSGGTRRKLVAAIALACEPRVCFLDEPTTGVDVGTRQFLWERIKAKGRRGCALILTTHYMEEADALAQRIGILVNGRLQVRRAQKRDGADLVPLRSPLRAKPWKQQCALAIRARRGRRHTQPCCISARRPVPAPPTILQPVPSQVLGSPQHLKSAHGGGYRLELKGPAESAGKVRDLVESLFPGTKQLEMHGGWQVFEVGGDRNVRAEGGRAALFALGPVFTALDNAKEDLGIETYTLSQTTLEQVFLNIAAAQQEPPHRA